MRPIYEKTNKQTENVSKILYFILVYVLSVVFTQLPVIISIYKYISSDFSGEALRLIYPAM